MMTTKAILIAGPTASGKSALAIDLARKHRGVVINADSMQVYRELRVITARPSEIEMEGIPHVLYGHVPGNEAYSVARWLEDAAAAIAEAHAAGRMPVIVGGTGLYFRCLLEGLSPIPQIPPEVREHWRAEAHRLGSGRLHEVLVQRDPVMAARLIATDTQRVVRALEVVDATGRSLAEWQALAGAPVVRAEEAELLVLNPDRAELYRRCDRRFDLMMAAGALEEVRALAELRLDPALPIMRALGVPELTAHLRGSMTRDDAVKRAKIATRQYAKRQQTWLKRYMSAWKYVFTT